MSSHAMMHRIALKIEARLEEGEVIEEDAHAVKQEWSLFEGRGIVKPFDGESVPAPRWHRTRTRTDDDSRKAAHEQRYESNGTNCPSEPSFPGETLEDERIDSGAEATAQGCSCHSEGTSFREVCWHDGNRWRGDARCAQSHAKTLRQEDLPVLSADAGQHEPNADENSASDDEGSAVAGVKERSHDNSDGHEAEYLSGSDPGNGRSRGGRQQNSLIVCLKCSEAVEEAAVRTVSRRSCRSESRI